MADEKQNIDKLQREFDSSQQVQTNRSEAFSEPTPAYTATRGDAAHLPTVSDPFNFPSDAPLPAYSATEFSDHTSQSYMPNQQQRIAIPQLRPEPTSPFLAAYPPYLLRHGITEEAWKGFLDAMSGFLSAKVSNRAISRAGDVAKHVGEHPKKFGKGLASHAKSTGRNITDNAKKGNILGAAFGVIGGIITLPLHAATGVVATGLSLPGHAIAGISKTPKTPYERALAYSIVANEEWFVPRGLQVGLVDTNGLASLSSLDAKVIVNATKKTKNAGEALRALEQHVAPLQMAEQTLELGTQTVWLVVHQVDPNQL